MEIFGVVVLAVLGGTAEWRGNRSRLPALVKTGLCGSLVHKVPWGVLKSKALTAHPAYTAACNAWLHHWSRWVFSAVSLFSFPILAYFCFLYKERWALGMIMFVCMFPAKVYWTEWDSHAAPHPRSNAQKHKNRPRIYIRTVPHLPAHQKQQHIGTSWD
jgi:hypothetical protein